MERGAERHGDHRYGSERLNVAMLVLTFLEASVRDRGGGGLNVTILVLMQLVACVCDRGKGGSTSPCWSSWNL